MSESKLRVQSMDLAVSIVHLVKSLKEKRESIVSNQIGRSGTSIGANKRQWKVRLFGLLFVELSLRNQYSNQEKKTAH